MKTHRISLFLIAFALSGLWTPQLSAQTCIDPNVLVLFDYSGSLLSGNKYQDAIGALNDLTSKHESGIRFGLSLFPYLKGSDGSNDTYKCSFSTELTVPMGINNHTAIKNFFTSFGAPKGSYDTPMLQAFQVVVNAKFNDGTQLGEIKNPGRRNYVILFTDGVQDCCWDEINGTQYSVEGTHSYVNDSGVLTSGTHKIDCDPSKKYFEPGYLIQDELELNRQHIASYVTALKNAGIQTFVVGLGTRTDPVTLDLLAKKGGTERYAGCTGDCYYQVATKAELIAAFDAIAKVVKTETCDGIDNDCDGKIDEDLERECGTKCGKGTETCNMGNWEGCNAPQPKPEKCDGEDNNCDGKVDEGLKRSCNTSCGTGEETCVNGEWKNCDAPQPEEKEICGDNKDNNCNGKTDEGCQCNPNTDAPKPCSGTQSGICKEGVQVCQPNGTWGPCSSGNVELGAPQPETCDGHDNDCDGVIDNIKRECNTACGSGTQTCTQGNWGDCSAPTPSAEICDGKDNDCDGKVDEELTRVCKTKCGSGEETCVNGNWVNCTAQQPQPEICDNKDNDCDGEVDEDLVKQCSSNCGVGLQTCDDGVLSQCNSTQPVDEKCDGLDNNCDGQVDEGNICGPNSVCYCGACATTAVNGECFGNRKPIGGYCVVDNCPAGTQCNDSGDCIDHDGPIDVPGDSDVNNDQGDMQTPDTNVDKGNDTFGKDGANTGGNEGGSETGKSCGCRSIQSSASYSSPVAFGMLMFLLFGMLFAVRLRRRFD